MEPANILKIESLSAKWCDKDHVMLHACFQLLKDCIEKECLLDGVIDWGQDEKHVKAQTELLELYNWWQQRVSLEDSKTPPDTDQFDQDTRMLTRLVNIRWALWT